MAHDDPGFVHEGEVIVPTDGGGFQAIEDPFDPAEDVDVHRKGDTNVLLIRIPTDTRASERAYSRVPVFRHAIDVAATHDLGVGAPDATPGDVFESEAGRMLAVPAELIGLDPFADPADLRERLDTAFGTDPPTGYKDFAECVEDVKSTDEDPEDDPDPKGSTDEPTVAELKQAYVADDLTIDEFEHALDVVADHPDDLAPDDSIDDYPLSVRIGAAAFWYGLTAVLAACVVFVSWAGLSVVGAPNVVVWAVTGLEVPVVFAWSRRLYHEEPDTDDRRVVFVKGSRIGFEPVDEEDEEDEDPARAILEGERVYR